MIADLIQAHKAALATLAELQDRQRALEAQHSAAIEARRMATILPDPFRPGGWCAGLGPDFIAGRIARSFESAVVYADAQEREAMAAKAAEAQRNARDVFALLDAHDAASGLPAALAATEAAQEAEQAALAALAQARPSTFEARAYLADAPTLTLAAARAALRLAAI